MLHVLSAWLLLSTPTGGTSEPPLLNLASPGLEVGELESLSTSARELRVFFGHSNSSLRIGSQNRGACGRSE